MSSDRRFVVGCLCLLLAVTTSVHGQDRQRRRQFVDGLLKTLIDSQLPEPPTTDARAASSAGTVEARVGVTPTSAAKIREAARLLTQASDEMSQLVGALQSDLYRSQGIRSI